MLAQCFFAEKLAKCLQNLCRFKTTVTHHPTPDKYHTFDTEKSGLNGRLLKIKVPDGMHIPQGWSGSWKCQDYRHV